jgi:acetyl-CoA carboxylase biotin carboxyl carrier protein
MDPKDLKRLLDALKDAEVKEFSLETADYKVSVKRGAEVIYSNTPQPAPVIVTAPQPQQPVSQPAAVTTPDFVASSINNAPIAAATGYTQKAPIVGTFYASSSPDAAAFVQVGSKVEAGKVICIIEAMKLMNEIEAEISGTIKEILVKNAQPVEYGQPLFVIE